MGQILVVQDAGEISGALAADHAVVRANGVEEVRRALTKRFEVAILDREGGAETEAVLAALHHTDADLSVVLVTAKQDSLCAGESPDGCVWEVVPRPFSPQTLQSAVRRAGQHTYVLRENHALRNQVGRREPGNGEASHSGNGANLNWIESLPPHFDLRGLLSSVEKNVIQRTLEATRGAQAEAARRLGVSRSDLSYKLAKYELRKPAERQL